MRIDQVYIEDYKNLKQFTINLDENEMKTVLLGQNASGKSNFIEALILIFKYLDLSTDSKRQSPNFDYNIVYNIQNNVINVTCQKGNYVILVNDEKQTFKYFFSDEAKAKYQPKYVFTYYSGLSNKLKELFWDHQNNFYRKIIKEDFKDAELDSLRKLFYVQLVHSYFVLLAYFTHEEEESIKFLNEVLNIIDIESILFVLKMPPWAVTRIKNDPDDIFWTADGLVRQFLDKLWELSLAPIHNDETIRTEFAETEDQKRLYLFLKGKDKLQELAKTYTSNTALFKALESTYISKLIAEVKIKVKKKNVDGSITFKELSEGEQQLLTVLGLLKFTKDEDSLILLDEPDTHLNPIWKWRYLEFLDKVVHRPASTQIILSTHDPLVIGGLKKEEVRIFRTISGGSIRIEEPEIDPKLMNVAKILTSELFGLPSIMSKELEDKVNRKRYLQTLLNSNKISKKEIVEYNDLSQELEDIGFYNVSIDSRYNMFVELTSKHEVFQKSVLTKEEEKELERISKEVAEEILKSNSQGSTL
ncbi:MAG: AAA family ATPase [Bacilli bacterium]|nr:AAA family ATPase [Bacilli bacterium]MDD4759898.1 AAA family ATPase [Bacteroidaceae bacterium]